ncbi:SCO6880 family protein [Luteipulveratus mongoliensis]|uniref:Integral membrane protein n=1 Tax=Luteipulveratus mongoliensis TaxID=571913 RepID=A0A0K1JEM4_9MICO|nr:SCO6880 family protein [Luteipulveratus mongoliensis]AKU15045.1 hypothetical protein VV02_02865 [Luteipulveratus mongoliensis]
MSTETAADRPEITYGNLRKPGLPGLFGLSALQAVATAAAAMVLMVLCVMGQLVAAGVWFALVAIALVPVLVPSRDEQNRYSKMGRWFSHASARRKGKTLLRQGVAGRTPEGTCRLPGLAAQSQLSEFTDAYGRAFGLISIPRTHHHTVVIEANAPGTTGVDRESIDSQVAHWAAWLADLRQSGDIVAAAVVVETAPDSGQRLRRFATRGLVQDAPEFSTAVLGEVLDTLPAGSAAISTRIAITFTGRPRVEGMGSKALSTREMADEIATRLPGLVHRLGTTGAGTTCRACTAQEIVDLTRVAFDPSAAADVEQARLEGTGTGLTWKEAGPIAAQTNYESYVHESAISRTWQMQAPPRGVFYAATLKDLLSPHRDIARKRVALLYRPEDPEASATAVERDINWSRWRASQKERMTERARADLEAAQKAAREEQAGASLVRFGMLVTATVLDEADMPMAEKAVVSNLAAPARLKLRVAKGSQDVAFMAALPLGVILPEHMRLPTSVREAL